MNVTLVQAHVTACLGTLLLEATTPTRALVRTRALENARAAMHPGDGASPIVYFLIANLPPRAVRMRHVNNVT
jgi:hypothetical protein